MTISAVLFDFDGTLTAPHGIDFDRVRAEIGCPPGESVLEYIEALPDPAHRSRAGDVLHRVEMEAAARARPNRGTPAALAALHDMGLPASVLTRNSRAALTRALDNFDGIDADHFTLVLTRDDDFAYKPAPDALLHAAAAMGARPAEMLCVGDYVFDIAAAAAAGCPSVFVTNDRPLPPMTPTPGHCISALDELLPLIEALSRD